MRPLFTVHAGEFLVGQYIEGAFKDKNVWVPTRDTGIDLLVSNSLNTKTATLQVKFSRDFLPTMKMEPSAQKQLRSCTWFSLPRDKIARSSADYWVLVLVGFEKRSYDYLIITPQDLLKRLEAIHGSSKRYQMYVWVTKTNRAWLTRGVSKADQGRIASNTFVDKDRELTAYLNDWTAIRDL